MSDTKELLQRTVSFCKDIGMFTINRPVSSCTWRTSYCVHCYNSRLYKIFPGMKIKDPYNESAWNVIDGKILNEVLNVKRKQTKRIRLMSRGEAFSNECDIERVKDILNNNKKRIFWVPTRAWRNEKMRKILESEIFNISNIRLMASIDPSNNNEEIASLINSGWSTMYYGNNTETEGRYICPKTHKKIKGHCATCRNGCFSKKQVHVHLKKH